MKWFYLFILSISFFWGCTQNLDGVKKCQEDIDYFFKIIETLHETGSVNVYSAVCPSSSFERITVAMEAANILLPSA